MVARWSSVEKPANFDPEHPRADPVAYLEQKEYAARESMVKVAEAKLLKEKVQECYWREGVNHLQNCKQQVEAYLVAIKGVGIYTNNSGRFDKN